VVLLPQLWLFVLADLLIANVVLFLLSKDETGLLPVGGTPLLHVVVLKAVPRSGHAGMGETSRLTYLPAN